MRGLFLKGGQILLKQSIYNTALYLRLSRDDDNVGESNSIATQRMMLRRYAEQNDLHVVDEYIDDGYSGTNFDRPDFQRMINDIEAGRINCVVTKDLSRLGRNYIMVGQYQEIYFPAHGVRYIAIDSGVDSLNQQSSEFTPFLNVINEWYARDISRKVKKALRTRSENGAHYGNCAPLGYKKDPDHVGHLLIDDETSWIIKKIFALAMQGMGAGKITRILAEDKTPTSSWINYQRSGLFANLYEGQPEEVVRRRQYEWTIAQVKSMLQDETYIGNSVHNRQAKVSFKSKKRVNTPKSEWWCVENTHEGIISKDDFEQVQKIIASRHRAQKDGTTQIFAGLVKCADCGWTMIFATNGQHINSRSYYRCCKYGQGLKQCTIHYIRYDVLYQVVLARLQYWIQMVHQDEDEIHRRLLQVNGEDKASSLNRAEKEIARCRKRLTELDNLVAKIYEDQLSGKITDRNFRMLSEKYQKEQNELEDKIEALTPQLVASKQQAEGVDKWINRARKYTNPTELTAELLNALIEKILIHEAVKDADGHREQEIEIYYRFIGKID